VSREFVSDDPLRMPPGVVELLSDPTHFSRVEMRVIDYSEAPAGPVPGWEPLFDAQPEPKPKPKGRWQRIRKACRGT
jgi:hypothetical protein